MKLTLIITTYNWPEALGLVLQSIRAQSMPPHEIIIADDGSNNKTKKLINDYGKRFKMKIIHCWQEDKGFRAARSRNNAIIRSSGDYIVLIDGDTVLHRDFVADHYNLKEKGFFIQGSRALLSKKVTEKAISKNILKFNFFSFEMKNRKNSLRSSLLSKIFSTKKNHLNGIKSCNMSFFKNDCIKVNGFNNDFEGWGREDSEFIVRMMNSGIVRKNIRFNALQFHLWHNENERRSLEINDLKLQQAINLQSRRCENGINLIKYNES